MLCFEVADADERQDLPQYENVRIQWLERNGFAAVGSTLLEDMLTDFEAPDGDAIASANPGTASQSWWMPGQTISWS